MDNLISAITNYEKIREETRKDVDRYSKIVHKLSTKAHQTDLFNFESFEFDGKEMLHSTTIQKIKDNLKIAMLGEILFDNPSFKKENRGLLEWYEYLMIAARSYQKFIDLLGPYLKNINLFEIMLYCLLEYHNSMKHAASFSLSKKARKILTLLESEEGQNKELISLYNLVLHYLRCNYNVFQEEVPSVKSRIKSILIEGIGITSKSEQIDIIVVLYIISGLEQHINYLMTGKESSSFTYYFEKAINISIKIGRMDLLYLSEKLLYSAKILSKLSFWNLNKFFKVEDEENLTHYIRYKLSDGKYFLFPSQYTALQKGILNKESERLIIAMPTGAGKTLLGELFSLNDMLKNKDPFVLYISPSRALAREKFIAFEKVFKTLNPTKNVCLLTGDVVLDSEKAVKGNDLIVMTPEKFDMILRNKFYGRNVTTIVFDEFHNMRTGFRGIRMEFDIIRAIHTYPNCKIFLISAILSPENFGEVSKWINSNYQFETNWKPTFLKIGSFDAYKDKTIIKFNDGTWSTKEYDANIRANAYRKQTIELAYNFAKEAPCLIYCSNKRDVEYYMKNIHKFIEENKLSPPDYFNKKVNDTHATKLKRILSDEESLYKLFRDGIGVHKGDLPHKIRHIMEECLKRKGLYLMISTSTLAEGVNMPIKTILIPKLLTGRDPMEKSLFFNLIGRAGRPFKEIEGQVILVSSKKFPGSFIKEYAEVSVSDIESIRTPLERLIKYQKEFEEDPSNKYAKKEVQKNRAVLNSVLLALIVEDKIKTIAKNQKIISEIIIGAEKETEEIKILKGEISKIFASIEKQLIAHNALVKNKSILNVTEFGFACYKTGFCSESCRKLVDKFEKQLKTLKPKINVNFIPKKVISSLLDLVDVPIETMMFFSEGLPKNFKEITTDWIYGKSIIEISKDYFKNNRTDALIHVESLLSGFVAWFFYAIYVLVEYKKEFGRLNFDVNSAIPNALATYAYYGSSDKDTLTLLKKDISRKLIREDVLNFISVLRKSEVIKTATFVKQKKVPKKVEELIVQEYLIEEKDLFIKNLNDIMSAD